MLGATLAVLALPGAASGDGEEYKAGFAGRSAYLTLESGETASSFFRATNIGTATWVQSVVKEVGSTTPGAPPLLRRTLSAR